MGGSGSLTLSVRSKREERKKVRRGKRDKWSPALQQGCGLGRYGRIYISGQGRGVSHLHDSQGAG